MKIKASMINREIRGRGCFVRVFSSVRTEEGFRKAQKLMEKNRFLMRKLLNCREIVINTPHNSSLRVCISGEAPDKKEAVGLLWIHGGGYATGMPYHDAVFINRFIEATDCVVVSPDYRLSTQVPYPAALEDCYSSLLWMRDNAEALGIRKDKLFVGGDSAGGGLTAAVSLLARDKGEVAIAFQLPLYPMLDDRMITPSSQNNNAPVWDSRSNEIAWKMYLGELYGTESVPKYAAPSRETDYSRLPPTYTFVGSLEPFRDETLEYVANLVKAGVHAEADVYEGCYHAFDVYGIDSEIAVAARKKYIEKFVSAAEHYTAAQPEG